jgi:hypothetical protein
MVSLCLQEGHYNYELGENISSRCECWAESTGCGARTAGDRQPDERAQHVRRPARAVVFRNPLQLAVARQNRWGEEVVCACCPAVWLAALLVIKSDAHLHACVALPVHDCAV